MVRTAVPAVAGFIVAVAMDRNRFFTGFKLLPGLLGDPFGSAWICSEGREPGWIPLPLGSPACWWSSLR